MSVVHPKWSPSEYWIETRNGMPRVFLEVKGLGVLVMRATKTDATGPIRCTDLGLFTTHDIHYGLEGL